MVMLRYSGFQIYEAHLQTLKAFIYKSYGISEALGQSEIRSIPVTTLSSSATANTAKATSGAFGKAT